MTPFISKPNFSRDLTVFIRSFIPQFKIMNVVLPDLNIFLWIDASVTDTAADNPNGIKTLLSNGLSTFLTIGDPVFSNGPKSLPKNPSDCPILCNWVFESFISADEPFKKALQIFETCVLFNNNLCERSLESLTTFD